MGLRELLGQIKEVKDTMKMHYSDAKLVQLYRLLDQLEDFKLVDSPQASNADDQ